MRYSHPRKKKISQSRTVSQSKMICRVKWSCDENFLPPITHNYSTQHARTSYTQDKDHVDKHIKRGWRDDVRTWLHLCRGAARWPDRYILMLLRCCCCRSEPEARRIFHSFDFVLRHMIIPQQCIVPGSTKCCAHT